MHIAVIIKNGFVNEVIVPDNSVKVMVIDGDDPMGAETVTVENIEACVDTAAVVKHIVNPTRLGDMLSQFRAGLLELEQDDQVRKVLKLLESTDTK